MNMQESLKYTIFRTKWGYFGLVATEDVLCKTCLPLPNREIVKAHLLKNRPAANQITNIEHSPLPLGQACPCESRGSSIEYDKSLFKMLQEQIIAYFEGSYVDFSPAIPIVLDGFSSFYRSVLFACRKIKFGQVITYLDLAKKIGRPSAARAVGNALARNPMPLIIPCHRIIGSDGNIGGFSVPGGTNMKKRLLELENQREGSPKAWFPNVGQNF
jgi:methylated-DNA-[protein]-cysteine S-methyltransferase